MSVAILTGDCRDVLQTLEAGSFQTCVTSPPYFGLRDYGHADLAREVAEQPHMFDELGDDEHDAEYGLWCGDDAA